jgi:hypothetical protein
MENPLLMIVSSQKNGICQNACWFVSEDEKGNETNTIILLNFTSLILRNVGKGRGRVTKGICSWHSWSLAIILTIWEVALRKNKTRGSIGSAADEIDGPYEISMSRVSKLNSEPDMTFLRSYDLPDDDVYVGWCQSEISPSQAVGNWGKDEWGKPNNVSVMAATISMTEKNSHQFVKYAWIMQMAME